jgi:DNA-binding IclR family transcriptional regulator
MRQEKQTAQVAQRVLEALRLVIAERDGLTPKELALHLGTSLSTAYHIVHALESAGFVTRRRRGVVSPGPTFYRLLEIVQERQHLDVDALRRLADQVSEATESRAYVAVWADNDVEVVYIRGRRGHRELPGMARGFRGAAHALALGKVLLVGQPLEHWPAYLRARPLPAFTPYTVTEPAQLATELERVEVCGVAYDREEFTLGSCCISVPVLLQTGRGAVAKAALAISVPPRRFAAEHHTLTGFLRSVTQPLP